MAAERIQVPMAAPYLDQVLAVERASFGDPWPPAAFLSELDHSWSWFRLIGPPGSIGAIERVDGFVICWMLSGDMHLLNLAVQPDHRRQGLARQMLAEALRVFARNGGGLVSLEVRPSNLAAREMYRNLGFSQVGVRRRYYRKDNEDALVLVSQVPAAPAQSARAGGEAG